MVLAEKKKQENISEYIIYMYQTELLVRNFAFDIGKIRALVVKHIKDENLDKAGKEELVIWYQEVISKMLKEELGKEGHLNEVQNIVKELSDLSMSLQVKDNAYFNTFNVARPFIRKSIQAADGLLTDPIQACLNGVFGLLIARMNGTEVDTKQMKAIEHFGNVLSLLSYHYGNTEELFQLSLCVRHWPSHYAHCCIVQKWSAKISIQNFLLDSPYYHGSRDTIWITLPNQSNI